MTPLTEQQKQLLFDYCMQVTSEQEAAEAQKLIFSQEQAAEFYDKLKKALAPLDCMDPEPCPDELVEGTVWRFKQQMSRSQSKLEQLIALEQKKSASRFHLWWEIIRPAAVAAVFIIVGSVLFGGGRVALNYAHQRYWQHQCASQLGSIFQGLENYRADNDGQMPALAAAPGSPWWKVGYEGKENHSNTRRMWLLVKHGYTDVNDFVCPMRKEAQYMQVDPEMAKQLSDFPGRNFVTYSFRISCPKSTAADERPGRVIIADLNPLFEILPELSEPGLRVRISDELLGLNSSNHNRRGQNVLFCDGSCRFMKTRQADVTLDDIFTLQDKTTYEGTETPSCETDAFLAP